MSPCNVKIAAAIYVLCGLTNVKLVVHFCAEGPPSAQCGKYEMTCAPSGSNCALKLNVNTNAIERDLRLNIVAHSVTGLYIRTSVIIYLANRRTAWGTKN